MYKTTLRATALLTFFLFLSFISVLGALPFQVSDTVSTLTIDYPKTDYFVEGTAFKLHFHVYNSSGRLLTPGDPLSTDCYIHGYDNVNNHIIQANLSADSNGIDYYYQTTGNIKGVFPFVVWCNNSQEAGFISGSYEVTPNGEKSTRDTIWYILLGFLFLTLSFMYLIHRFKEDQGVIIVYGIIAGTICALFGYWFLSVNGYITNTLLNLSIFALILGVMLFFFVVSFSLRKEVKESKD